MLAANIIINSIDYESTIQGVYPMVADKIKGMDSGNIAVSLLQQLGDDAVPVINSVLYRIPDDTKNDVVAQGVNAFSSVIVEKINEVLNGESLGGCGSIGDLSMVYENRILVNVDQIEINFQAIAKNPKIKGIIDSKLGMLSPVVKAASGLAAFISTERIEKTLLDILSKGDNMARVMNIAKSALTKKGIAVDIADVKIRQTPKRTVDTDGTKPSLVLTDEVKDTLVTALAGYLRDSVSRGL